MNNKKEKIKKIIIKLIERRIIAKWKELEYWGNYKTKLEYKKPKLAGEVACTKLEQ
jgi:hypothetical protein